MGVSDKSLGYVLTAAAAVIFFYYSVWVLVLPFVDESHVLTKYFPERIYAIAIPTLILVLALFLIFGFMSIVMINNSKKRK